MNKLIISILSELRVRVMPHPPPLYPPPFPPHLFRLEARALGSKKRSHFRLDGVVAFLRPWRVGGIELVHDDEELVHAQSFSQHRMLFGLSVRLYVLFRCFTKRKRDLYNIARFRQRQRRVRGEGMGEWVGGWVHAS